MSDSPLKPEEGVDEVQALISRMDELLKQGAAARARVDEFYQNQGLEPGIGAAVLLSEAVSERDREIFRRLIAEYEMMEQRVQSFAAKAAQEGRPGHASDSAPPRPVGTLAVGNRYRI